MSLLHETLFQVPHEAVERETIRDYPRTVSVQFYNANQIIVSENNLKVYFQK
jgi:hypothetical protein